MALVAFVHATVTIHVPANDWPREEYGMAVYCVPETATVCWNVPVENPGPATSPLDMVIPPTTVRPPPPTVIPPLTTVIPVRPARDKLDEPRLTVVVPMVMDGLASAPFGTAERRALFNVPDVMFDAFVVSEYALATSIPPAPTFKVEPSVPAKVRLLVHESCLPDVGFI